MGCGPSKPTVIAKKNVPGIDPLVVVEEKIAAVKEEVVKECQSCGDCISPYFSCCQIELCCCEKKIPIVNAKKVVAKAPVKKVQVKKN